MAEERTAPDVQRMGLQAEKIWREAERRIMEDVIRRIRKTGEITSTADYQINRLIDGQVPRRGGADHQGSTGGNLGRNV